MRRRDFLKTAVSTAGGAAALGAGGGAVLGAEGAARAAGAMAAGHHVTGSDVLRVGLVGCGGRGTGAAAQALQADAGARLVAMADLFEDRLRGSLASLQKQSELAGKIDVPPERQFVGFGGCEQLLAAGVDVVLLATPPQFRPAHLRAAVDAGVHIFAEKPVAVDAPGVRRVLEACEDAARKGLSVVSGLCLRYHYGFRELVRRVHDGAIGEIHTLQANDYRGTIWVRRREPDWTDMHWQCRNWYYFTWLSGDFNVEQHVHFLDVCAWLMKDEYPAAAVGMGGRQVRTGEEHGNIYDHHGVVYEYAGGAKLFSNTRQMRGCHGDMSAAAAGSNGRATISESRGGLRIATAEGTWVYQGEENNIFQTEHDELFRSIRAGKPINNGRYMALSTLLAIMGRMATYTGQRVTWEQALNSQEDLSPERLAWGLAPKVEIAMPGITPLR